MLLFDSVFGTFRYADDPMLIPAKDIIATMGKIELDALEQMNKATKAAVKDFKKRAVGKSLSELKAMNWDLAPDIADTINVVWDKGYKTGSRDAIKEMKNAVPVKQNAAQYAKISDLIKQLFELKPFSVFDRPKAAVKKILSRNLLIAGDYSKEILERVKDNLSQGMIEQPRTGYPMPPKQVNALLQETLTVSQARAATISRTETTNAYSEARVETFKQSSLATHCRFLAIADDRVTDICLTRNGIVFPIADAEKFRPALHFNCFPKGTKILMGDGSEKNIEAIEIGDSVKVATAFKVQKVYNVITSRFTGNLREIVLENGKTIISTPDHPIWDGQAFTKAAQIRVGQKLWIDSSMEQRTQRHSGVLLCDSKNADGSFGAKTVHHTGSNEGDYRVCPNQNGQKSGSVYGSELAVLRTEWQQDHRDVSCGQDGNWLDRKTFRMPKAKGFGMAKNLRGVTERKIRSSSLPVGTRTREQKRASFQPFSRCSTSSRASQYRQKTPRCFRTDEKAQSCSQPRNSKKAYGYEDSQWQRVARKKKPVLWEKSETKGRAYLQSRDTQRSAQCVFSLDMGSQFCKNTESLKARVAARTDSISVAKRDNLSTRLLFAKAKSLHRNQGQMDWGCVEKIRAFQGDLSRNQDSCDRRGEIQDTCPVFQNITPLRVAEIKDIPFDDIVYNLSVENDEIYFANGVLVHNCRSTISVLLPRINPQHQKMVDDPSLDPNNRQLAPLLKGWR